MSKKMMKRSLALGVLMAFVITGSAMAAESVGFDNFVGETAKNGTIEVNKDTIVDRGTTTNKILGNYTLSVKDDVTLTLNNINKGTSGTNIIGNGNIIVNADETVSGYDGAGVAINGDMTVKTLTINAINPNGRNDKGIAAGYGNDITITATDSVTITSGDIGIHTEGDGTPKTTVTITTNDLTITSLERSAILNSDINDVIVNATGNVVMNSAHGIYHSGSGKTEVTGQNINMTSKSYGVYATYAEGASVEINATNDLTIVSGGEIATTSKDSEIILTAGNDTKITCDVYANAGSINVDAGKDIVINGNVNANKGQIFVEADNNVTVNGNVESRSGEGSGHLPYVDIKSGEDIVVNGALVAHWAEGSKDGSRPEGLKLEGNNITVNAGDANVLYNGAGKTSFVANGNIVLNGKNGLANEGGNINVVADNINITAEGFAIISYSGTTEITPTGSSNIVGDIFVDDLYSNATPVVNVDLGEGGSLTGAVVNEHTGKDSGVNLDLGVGSTWNVTGASNVSKLDGTSANIKVSELTKDLVTIDEKGADTEITVTTSSDNFEGTADEGMVALASVVTVDGEAAANKLVATAGAVYDEVTADVEDGKVTNVNKTVAEANLSANDMAAVGLMSWRAEMNDMNKRMGELRNANGDLGVWVRMVRGESEYNSVKNQYNQYQLGYDEKLSVDPSWTVGVALSYTDAQNNFAQGNGESTNKALSFYGSKLNEDGTFVDLIAKYARLENEFDIVSGMGDADYSTNGYSFSAEFGKRIQQGKGLWIEPQVELTYGKVSAVDYITANGVNVAQDGMESLVGRVGFSLGKDIKDGNVYARASYLYDFEGETQATLNNDAVLKQDLGGGWWEVGVGANINLSKATYIYADVEKTFGGEVDTNWQWNLGVRYSF